MSEKYSVVTEVGTFGGLNIEDPTKKDVDKKDENLEELINEATKANLENLSKKN